MKRLECSDAGADAQFHVDVCKTRRETWCRYQMLIGQVFVAMRVVPSMFWMRC